MRREEARRVAVHEAASALVDIEGESQAPVESPSDARSSGDALALPQGCLQGLVEKPSDARSCGDAFAPPQGCQALVEKPSDIDSDADMIIFKKACGVLLVFPFPCRRVVCHWCERRSDEDMGCLWRHICPY